MFFICLLIGGPSLFSGTADFKDFRSAHVSHNCVRCFTGPSGPEDQDFLSGRIDAGTFNHRFHSEVIGVETAELSVSVDDRIHCADAAGLAADLIEIRNDSLFVGDRHVDTLELFCAHERIQFIRPEFMQFIGIRGKFFVNVF